MHAVLDLSQYRVLPPDFDQYRPAMRAYALSLTRASGEEDDLVQEAFKRALQVQADGREIRKPRAYLMCLIHNAFIDARRAAKDQDADAVDDLSVPGIQELQQTCRQVLEAIETLPPDHRKVLLMAGVEGQSYSDIADSLGVVEGTVTSRLARARAALRARLGWDGNTLTASP